MELKDVMIMLAFVLGIFVLIGIPYANVTNNVTVEGADGLSLANSSAYETQLDNIKKDARQNSEDTSNLDTSGGSTFDKLGALVEKAFSVASKSVSTSEDSLKLVEDIENDTSSIIPPVVFTFIIAVVFLLILFGLVRLLTGR